MKHITIKYLQSGMSLLASIMILYIVIIFILLDVKRLYNLTLLGGLFIDTLHGCSYQGPNATTETHATATIHAFIVSHIILTQGRPASVLSVKEVHSIFSI